MALLDENNHCMKKVRKLSLAEGFFYSFMVGIGETYLLAFALYLSLSERKAAVIGIPPVVLGSFLHLLLLRIYWLKLSYRNMVLVSATIQALRYHAECCGAANAVTR